jgi:hypothetical protein
MSSRFSIVLIVLIAFLSGCKAENPTTNLPPNGQFFTVQVANDVFVMYTTDTVTIQQATENFQGKNHRFPLGRIATGNGGFNSPWSWHFVPDNVRMVEVSVEVCDGTPSYVNSHLNDYLAVGYCPWSAKVIKVGK